MKLAVIGCGTMGSTHAHELAKMDHIEFVGVCDSAPDKAESLAKACRTRAFTDFEEMIDAVDPDIVDICLPTHLHKEYALKAAKSGKHVITEKPISNSLADAREMIEACRKHQVRLFIGHTTRFGNRYIDARNKINSGAIGKVGVAHTMRYGAYPGRQKEWYADRSKSGGVIMDLMIHDIDVLLWTLGEVKSVYAQSRLTDALEYTTVTLRFESGAIANMEAMWGFAGPFTVKFEFAGSKGIIRNDSNQSGTYTLYNATSSGHPESVTHHYNQQWELRHFIECVQTGEDCIITPEEAYRDIEVAIAAMESIRINKPVNLVQFRQLHGRLLEDRSGIK